MKVTRLLASQVPIWEPSGEQTDWPAVVQVPVELPVAGAGAGAAGAAGADALAGAGAGAETGAGAEAGAGAVGAAMGAMATLVSCRAAPPAAGDGVSSSESPPAPVDGASASESPPAPVAGGPTADRLQSGSASFAVGSMTRDSPGLGYFKSIPVTVVHPLPMLGPRLATNISGRSPSRLRSFWPPPRTLMGAQFM